MLDFLSRTGSFYLGVFFVLSFAPVSAQINQDIYYKYCVATPDTACFEPFSGAVDTVGRDVGELGGGYRFCLAMEEVGGGTAPIQVVISIDKSQSMRTNDPSDMRTAAAHDFVDSLKARAPKSYVGSSIFADGFLQDRSLAPIQLSDPTGYDTLWNSLESGANSPQLRKKLDTYQGAGLTAALDWLLELRENTPGMKQHIIMITDDGWFQEDDIKPDEIMTQYSPQFPEGEFPKVHSVILTASGDPEGDGIEGLANIAAIAQLTGGLYIDNATPANIIATLLEILESMKVSMPNSLEGMSVTNLTNGEQRDHTSIQTVQSADTSIVQFQATMDNLPLEFGANTIVVKRVVKKPGTDQTEEKNDTVTIFRTKEWTTKVDPEEYSIHCTEDSTSISIKVTPEMRFLNDTFTVNSTIILKDKFILDSVDVRIFTKSPDTDVNTIAVYHLNSNLKNSAADNEGTGASVTYTDTDMLFGSGAMTSGSFSSTIGNLDNDFAFEMWIKPTSATPATELLSVGGFKFGIDNELKTVATDAESNLLKSEVALEINTWSHIAVSRLSGSLVLSINGLTVSAFAEYTSLLNGAATMKCPANAAVDEIRISNASRLSTESFTDAIRFKIPSVVNPTWIHKAQPYTQPVLTLPPGDWNSGNITFNFTSPVDGRLVVNFQHKGTELSKIWSKNGNPVFVAADLQGPFITHAIFTPGEITSNEDKVQIFFSEPVLCDSLKKISDPYQSFKVFEFIKDPVSGTTTRKIKDSVFIGSRFENNACIEERIDSVIVFVKTRNLGGIVPKLDSIMLYGTAVDTFGNYPDTTRLGSIKYGPGSGIEIAALPNDPNYLPMHVPDAVKTRLGIKEDIAKIVLIQTRSPLVPVDQQYINGVLVNNYSYKTVIYDAVANVVATDLIIRQSTQSDRMYYVVWPGLNRSNRRVSSGAYLLKTMVKYQNELDKFVPLQTKFSLKWSADN